MKISRLWSIEWLMVPLWEGVATPTPEVGHSGLRLLSQIDDNDDDDDHEDDDDDDDDDGFFSGYLTWFEVKINLRNTH